MTLEDVKKLGLSYSAIADRIGMSVQQFSRKAKKADNHGSTYSFTEAEQDAIRAALDGMGQELKDFSNVLRF